MLVAIVDGSDSTGDGVFSPQQVECVQILPMPIGDASDGLLDHPLLEKVNGWKFEVKQAMMNVFF